MNQKTKIYQVDIGDLIPCDWNYKLDGTQEEIDKLVESIKRDGSMGVLAVREVEKDGFVKLEVIDGNHRLKAIQILGWKKPFIENFGDISKAEAITIARRRNHQWFQDDIQKLANLLINEVLPEIKVEDYLKFMPDSADDLEKLKILSGAKEADEQELPKSGGISSKEVRELTITVSDLQYQKISDAVRKAKDERLDSYDLLGNEFGNSIAAICKKFLGE